MHVSIYAVGIDTRIAQSYGWNPISEDSTVFETGTVGGKCLITSDIDEISTKFPNAVFIENVTIEEDSLQYVFRNGACIYQHTQTCGYDSHDKLVKNENLTLKQIEDFYFEGMFD